MLVASLLSTAALAIVFVAYFQPRMHIENVIVTSLCSNYKLKRTGTKQRSDDRTTNLSRLIIIGNLRIDLFSVATVRDKNV